MNSIEVQNLSKVYGSTTAIEDVNFTVETGEIIGFLGPNGAGKTTTMRILAGYLPATTGTAKIAGYDVHQQSMEVRRRIGYLPENPPLYPEMTVEGFLNFVAKIKGVAKCDRKKKVTTVIERCQLEDKTKTAIYKLSKGYRQRVGIAQAIVHEPRVIILDEPTVGLDPRQIIEVRNLIKSLAIEHTIILSTHILPEVSMTCDRIMIINQGKIVITNSPDELQKQLAGNYGYQLELAGNIADLLPKLAAIPGVVASKVITENLNNQNRDLVEVTCNADSEPGKELAALTINQGVSLYEMRRIRPSLEDVFLELTTEEIISNE
ncbi:ABC-type multidrug transport system, ATPase component [Xenococcus sp. PCC 7305]|uniref:ABC transporter ATP-binding protein n=1 Tax=Xenococcus sp. PCC 7305 TaxID=102125 RepID=UPI0002ABBBA6|nr:ABC transporter ATP-binding protein [Xenococcus sp. PCC 7305]ELS01525.1 ABC-type multidrug transport system, ATPase component [Xenococcus sp. PCC 7305]